MHLPSHQERDALRTAIKTHSERDEAKLPFKIRIVRNEEQLNRAINIRSEAYSRHWPNLAETLKKPEHQDRNPNSIIFLAEAKCDGSPLGTMRVDTNLDSDLSTVLDIDLPENLADKSLAYVTRLGVKQGTAGSLVKLALFKSLHRYCLAKQIANILVGVRPPNDRDYVRLGFSDIATSAQLTPIRSSGGIPVRLMTFDVIGAERRWKDTQNPLYNFMFKIEHRDVEIFSSVSGMWTRPRQGNPHHINRPPCLTNLGIPLI